MARFKEKLQRDEAVFGTWITLAGPSIVEVLGPAGFDFLVIDGEHCAFSENDLRNAVMACEKSAVNSVVRVRANEEPRIKLALDLGADAVLVPMVNSADEARQAVQAAKYPPLGGRGIGPIRASDYFRNFTDYVTHANESTALIV